MSKRLSQQKATPKPNIRQFLSKDSDGMRSLRSNAMAGSNDNSNSETDPGQNSMLETLHKMEAGINTQLVEIRKTMADNMIDVKSNITNTDANVERVCLSVQSLTDNMKSLTASQQHLEIQNIKTSDKLTSLENRQDTLETEIEYLKKNAEFQDDEISALKAEVESLKEVKTEVEFLRKENTQYKIDKEANEQHQRKYNLWLYNITDSDPDLNLWENIRIWCCDVLEIEKETMQKMNVKHIHRVGNPKVKDRPIIVVFQSWEDRQLVLRSAGQLYDYNQVNGTKYGVKTDLAPLAREKRKKMQRAVGPMNAATKLLVRQRDNSKGLVWLEKRKTVTDKWDPVDEKEIKPEWMEPKPAGAGTKSIST